MQRLALLLIEKSQYFSVTPLPDDKWEVTFKEENRDLVKMFT